jgi:tRNA(Ile)-lysidine synthase
MVVSERDMLDHIASFITRHEMIPTSSRVGVAVSGGADSVFLLHALRELAPRWNLHLSVVHVEHGIRGAASKDDAEFVRQLAASFGLPFHIHHADLLAVDDNQEQAARRVRQNFFAQLISSGMVDRVATGHTRNDQAETVLYRILRGSGLAGLCGILPVTEEGLVRPLLELERAEIEAWLRAHNIAWREDATNQDRAYARNRLRHEILPLLRETFNPRLNETLSNMATVAQDEERYWQDTLVGQVGNLRADWQSAQTCAGSQPARRIPSCPTILTTAQLTLASPAVARRLIRGAIQAVKGNLRQIDFPHVERILEMARSQDGHDRVQLPGVDVFRSFEWIRLAPAGADNGRARDFSLTLEAPGSVELPGSTARITLQVLEKTGIMQARGTLVNELDWQRLHPLGGALPSLELRNWRPGDQYRPVGQSKQQKVKFLFQEARVPLWERGNWPIITYNGIIVWTRRFGAAAEFAAGPAARVVLRVEVSSESGNR